MYVPRVTGDTSLIQTATNWTMTDTKLYILSMELYYYYKFTFVLVLVECHMGDWIGRVILCSTTNT